MTLNAVDTDKECDLSDLMQSAGEVRLLREEFILPLWRRRAQRAFTGGFAAQLQLIKIFGTGSRAQITRIE